MIDRCNILIVGGGLAGITLAARLANFERSVWVLDQEEYSPAHTSGWALSPWDPAEAADEDVARLSWAGASLWDDLPGALVGKGMLHLFGEKWLKDAAAMWSRGIRAATGVRQLEPWEVAERFPWLKTDPAHCAAALWVPPGAAGTIDVRAVYGQFRTWLQERTGRILLDEALLEAKYGGRGWTIRTTQRTMRADVIVNCAGAWADDVARRCQARRVGLHSTKRAALSPALAEGVELPWRDCPFVTWHCGPTTAYCDARPDGRVVISPDMELSSSAGDSKPELSQIAAAIHQFEGATSLRIDEARSTSWGWQRTRVADGRPVIGWARETPGFFWMAGLGYVGAECSLSASAIAADMIRNRQDFSWLVDQFGIRTSRFSPDRTWAGVMA